MSSLPLQTRMRVVCSEASYAAREPGAAEATARRRQVAGSLPEDIVPSECLYCLRRGSGPISFGTDGSGNRDGAAADRLPSTAGR